MNDLALKSTTQEIVIDEILPHTPETIWNTLTKGELITRWLKMPIAGFQPVVGNRFTYQTTPAGAWDGLIRCQVLEVLPNERLVYTWTSGHEGNIGYGSALDTVVTWRLSHVADGTRLRLIHSGFITPRNESALKAMSEGWKKVMQTIVAITGEVMK
jgi:uncharacterized protein YndB with AHSA1/START domain